MMGQFLYALKAQLMQRCNAVFQILNRKERGIAPLLIIYFKNGGLNLKNKKLLIILAFMVLFNALFPVTQASLYAAGDQNIANLALGKEAYSSGNEVPTLTPNLAVDGVVSNTSRWSSAKTDDQWFFVDLGAIFEIDRVKINWHTPASKYQILISTDAENWINVKGNDVTIETNAVRNEIEEVTFNSIEARYVKFQGIERRPVSGILYGYAFFEFEVYKDKDLTKIIEGITEISVLEEQTQIIFPDVPKEYKISIYGSDRIPVIDIDGKIHKPLVDASVNLILQVEHVNNPDVKALTQNILVTVPGQYTQTDDRNAAPQVIPSLREWYGSTGNFILTQLSRIVVNPADISVLQHYAEVTRDDIRDISGLELTVASGTPEAGDIYLAIDNSLLYLGDEGYYFGVDDYVSITSATAKGVFYGTRSALQILKQTQPNNTISKGVAKDYPKYELRGLMLDVARKFYTIEFLQDYVKLLSWYKMNTFHIHLNESIGGFRLESETHPGITATDGNYTKEEFRNLVRLGMDYEVNVVPEIDTPGHSRAFTIYDPSLGQGHYLDISRQETIDFVKDLFDEYLDEENPTFLGPDVHVGTDEFHTNSQADIEIFRAYMDTLIKHINSKEGKSAQLWGGLTIYDGTTPVSNEAMMDIWHEPYGEAQHAIDLGYDIVNVHNGTSYIIPTLAKDYLNTQFIYNDWEPNRWGNTILPCGHPQLKGAKFALWNDVSAANGISMHDSHDRMLPAMQVIAEKTWSGTRMDKDYAQFIARAGHLGDAPNTKLSHKLEVDNEEGSVFRYYFEDDLKDSSGNGFDGAATNISFVNGIIGKGIRMNGGESFIETPIESLGFGWTLSMWINPDENNPDDAVIMESPIGQLKLTQGNTGKLGFSKENYNNSFNYIVPAGEWTHLLLTGDNKGTSLYVNGDEYVERLSLTYPYVQTFVLPIQKIGSATNSFNGTIDNLQVFNKQIDLLNFNNDLALNKKVESSPLETPAFIPEFAVDGDVATRWSAAREDDGWFKVDLGEHYEINQVAIKWATAYAKRYKILVSNDNENWTNVLKDDGIIEGKGGLEPTIFDSILARYVKFQGVERSSIYGYSFTDFEVYQAQNDMSEYSALITEAIDLIALEKGDSAIKSQLFTLLNNYPYDFESAIVPLEQLIVELIKSIEQEEQQGKSPDWPENSSVTVTNRTTTSVTLNWTPATDDNGVTGYKVSWLDDSIHVNDVKATIEGLSPGTSYTFKIQAINGVGNWSSALETTASTLQVDTNNGGSNSNGGSTLPVKVDGKLTLASGQSGNASLGEEIKVSIPSGSTDQELRLTIERLINPGSIVGEKDVLISSVFEVLKNFKDNFLKPVTVSLKFDPDKLEAHQKASIFYYDEAAKKWVELGGGVVGNRISAEVDYFAKFAVFAVTENGMDVPTEKPVFKDTAKHWAETAIVKAVEAGFVNGYPDGTFRPNAEITRAEFIVMLTKALKLQGSSQELNFSDQASIGQWARQAIAQAVEAGIINGYTDGTFRPNAKISRTEMVLMAVRALKLNAEAVEQTSFKDNSDIPQWAKASVEAAVKEGLVNGVGANKFAPNHTATRAESVTLLLKAIERRRS